MRHRQWIASVLLCSSSAISAASADHLQKSLRSRWLGAWVVTAVESYSDCNGGYTNNRINGALVRGSGAQALPAGELAKLDKVDVRRSRLDLHLSLAEPLLVAYSDGPFTLYREASCRIELQVELPREVVKAKDAGAVEELLVAVLERHATEASARDSTTWNARRRAEYPDDYPQTLAEHAVWQATLTNDAVGAQLDRAFAAAVELTHRVKSEAEYAAAFARGIADARGDDLTTCPRLLAADLGSFKRLAAKSDDDDPQAAAAERGFQDGRQLVYSLELIARLPDCYVPVPESGPDDD